MAPRRDGAKGYDAPSPTTVAAFCPDQLGAEAEHLSVCTGGPAAAWYADLTAGDTCTKIEAAVTAGRVKFDSSQTHACLEAYATFTCADGTSQGEPSACKAALGGTVAQNGKCYADIDCSGSDYCGGIDEATGTCSGKCTARIRQGHLQARRGVHRRILLLPRRQGRGDDSDVQQDPHVHPRGRQGGDLRLQQDDEEDRHVRAGAVVRRPHARLRAHAEGGHHVHGRRVGVRVLHGLRPDDPEVQAVPRRGRRLRLLLGARHIGCLGQTFCKPSASNPLAGSCANKEASGATCTAGDQCLSGHCDKASKDAGTGKCTAPCTDM